MTFLSGSRDRADTSQYASSHSDSETVDIKRELDREVLVSERKRALLLFGVFALVVLTFALSLLLIPEGSPLAPRGVRPVVIGIDLLGMAYAFLLWRAISAYIRSSRPAPNVLRYLGAAVEITIPTIIVAVTAAFLAPVSALLGPAPLFYFLFIILSTLRLSPLLSLFTGVVAAGQYVGLATYLLWISEPGVYPDELMAPAPYYFRGIVLLTAGAVAAYVSQRIWGQILSSFRTVEERNRVLNVFGQHVSPAVVERLLQQDVEIHGEIRNVCVMFLDIRDFTKFSESRQPEEVVEYLNSLFVFMIDCVNRNSGIVNKFLGDGFMAVFGAPISSADDRRNALTAAREIIAEVHQRNGNGTIPPTRVGIGLHAGAAVTGNVGSELRKEYTIIGDVVNLASRIEQLNKQFGSQVLVSETVLAAAPDALDAATDMGEVEVKGRAQPIRVYRLA